MLLQNRNDKGSISVNMKGQIYQMHDMIRFTMSCNQIDDRFEKSHGMKFESRQKLSNIQKICCANHFPTYQHLNNKYNFFQDLKNLITPTMIAILMNSDHYKSR